MLVSKKGLNVSSNIRIHTYLTCACLICKSPGFKVSLALFNSISTVLEMITKELTLKKEGAKELNKNSTFNAISCFSVHYTRLINQLF